MMFLHCEALMFPAHKTCTADALKMASPALLLGFQADWLAASPKPQGSGDFVGCLSRKYNAVTSQHAIVH